MDHGLHHYCFLWCSNKKHPHFLLLGWKRTQTRLFCINFNFYSCNGWPQHENQGCISPCNFSEVLHFSIGKYNAFVICWWHFKFWHHIQILEVYSTSDIYQVWCDNEVDHKWQQIVTLLFCWKQDGYQFPSRYIWCSESTTGGVFFLSGLHAQA